MIENHTSETSKSIEPNPKKVSIIKWLIRVFLFIFLLNILQGLGDVSQETMILFEVIFAILLIFQVISSRTPISIRIRFTDKIVHFYSKKMLIVCIIGALFVYIYLSDFPEFRIIYLAIILISLVFKSSQGSPQIDRDQSIQ